jgi:mRNA-degrading endonuclease toxin of MazEF toxin-antitoxin module
MRATKPSTYFPGRGDLIHIDFDPSAGHELRGPHFAVVLSTARFATATGFCIVVPGTSKYHADQRLASTQLMLALPDIPGLAKPGWVYTHQVRSVDFKERRAKLVAKIEDLDFLIDLMERVRAFIDPDSVV